VEPIRRTVGRRASSSHMEGLIDCLPASAMQVVPSSAQRSLGCDDALISSTCQSETTRALSVRKNIGQDIKISGSALNHEDTLKLPLEPVPSAVI